MKGILHEKLIVLGVTGSIAAVETVSLIHSLRRRGAQVQPVMTAAAMGILHPDALTYASGRQTITRISGMVEHIRFCGEGGEASAILIAPATANTIAKIACGIDDTPVTTFASTAIGTGIPVIIAPAMHESMYRNEALSSHLIKLSDWGLFIVSPRMEEGKAKVADEASIILLCERSLSRGPLTGKRVLVTGGRCEEDIDDVRIITTRSSGAMGREIALEAFRLGATVTLIHNGETNPCINTKKIVTANDMRRAVIEEIEKHAPDFYVSAAAVSDFIPDRIEGKLDGMAEVSIKFSPFPKILDEVLQRKEVCAIAFKLGRDPIKDGKKLIEKGVRLVIGNSALMPGARHGEVIFLNDETQEHFSGSKEEIARELWKRV